MRQSWCTRCLQHKPISEFSVKTRHADGAPATVLSRCKACYAEIKRLRRRADPAWAKEIDRRDWQRIKADPEKLAHRRQLTRENLTAYRQKRAETPTSIIEEGEQRA